MTNRRIPYISQHWRKCIAESLLSSYKNEEIDYWSHRSCGLSCLLMILHTNGFKSENMLTLHHQAMKLNAYCDKGWIHSNLSEMLLSHGINAQAVSQMKEEVFTGLEEGKLYICSVTHKFPTDGRTGGHLVLAIGIDDQGRVMFRDPSTWGETHDRIEKKIFFSSYSGRCIQVI